MIDALPGSLRTINGGTIAVDKPRLALDFDSTLANTREVAYKLMLGDDHDRDATDGPSLQSWEAPLDTFGAERFLSAMWHTYTLRPLQVPSLEDDLAAKVDALEEVFEVDIVTAHGDHMGVTQGKRRWLDHHDIPYNDLVVVDPESTKAHMDYGVYIDDKPGLPEQVNNVDPSAPVYLIDWPYNQDAPGDYVRVESLAEALRHYVWGTTNPNPVDTITHHD